MTICESFLKSIVGERINVYTLNARGDYETWLECAELDFRQDRFTADNWVISIVGDKDIDVCVCGDAVDIYLLK